MRTALLILSLLTSGTLAFGQNVEPCLFDNYQRKHALSISEADKKINNVLQLKVAQKSSDSIKTIPVVVHVIHNGGTENISDAQIQSQIRILNEDFGKLPGTNGDGNGVDTKIRFCLAKITPDGKCTDGIVRVKSTLTDHKTYDRSMLKNLSYWDNTRYLNMYIVKTINGGSGILGYASFPGGPPDEDGVLMLHNAFGDTGTVSPTSSYNLGRTTTHEVSHWFGLYHTFNGGCGTDTCTDGDYVCDTPPAANPNFGCPTINSCSNDSPNVNDQVQNYVDYSDDACKNMFTQGQKDRMHATLSSLRWDIWQPSNITSTGCDSGFVSPPCNVIADFTANGQSICVGNNVIFTNKSQNKPLTYKWYFAGGIPSTATTANVTVKYDTVGVYPVTLVATNTTGKDSLTVTNYITVTTPPVGQALPFIEGFEDTTFPPNGITISNPDNGITWERDTVGVPYAGTASAKINNLINTNYGQSDALILPAFNLIGLGYTPYIKFKWAYARSDANYSDELYVLVSRDCGVNFAQIFSRSGTGLVTGPTQTTPYITDSGTVWKSASVSLNNYISYNNVIIKIVNVTDGGNNLYIDNLSVGEQTVGFEDLSVSVNSINIFPNPVSNEATINYNLIKEESVKVSLIDILGREIEIIEQGNKAAGAHSLTLSKGIHPSGLYFIKFKAGKKETFRKIIIN